MKQDEISIKTQNRLGKILKVSFDIFLQKGYANTSLSDIVSQSGGSLSTIYKYFKNKEGLFKAILENGIKKFYKEIDKKIDLKENLSIEEFLYRFSDVYLDTVLNDKSVMFYRLVFSEAATKDINLKKIMYEYELTLINKILVDFLKKEEHANKFIDKDLESVAMSFWFSVREPFLYRRLLFNQNIKLKKSEKDAHIRKKINIFLHGNLR